MKTVNKRRIVNEQTCKQWETYQRVGAFVRNLGRAKDASEIHRDNRRSAPLSLLEMLF
ncbi:hypothetical protein [Olivibacter oleidegradans]|uniref:Uncharacterized protein n=1 Tax=Olivibacter oleidegradans TaxID=760123 RepID=A0ABV6HIL1_9SPHI